MTTSYELLHWKTEPPLAVQAPAKGLSWTGLRTKPSRTMHLAGLRKSTVFPDYASQAGLGLRPVTQGHKVPKRAPTPVSLGQQSCWGGGLSGRCHPGNSWAQLSGGHCPSLAWNTGSDAIPSTGPVPGGQAKPGDGVSQPDKAIPHPASSPAGGRISLAPNQRNVCASSLEAFPSGVTSPECLRRRLKRDW